MADSLDSERPDGDGISCNPFCEPCRTRKGTYVSVYGYCHECYKFICPSCHTKHSKLKRTRGHKVTRGEDMPHSMAAKPPKYDKCDIHCDLLMDQFCEQHRSLICTSCSLLEHKLCSVYKVVDICKNVSFSETLFLHGIVENIQGNLQDVTASVDEDEIKLRDEKKAMLCEADSLYKNALTKLTKMYDSVKDDIETQYSTHLETIDGLQRTLRYHSKSFDTIVEDTRGLIGKVVDEKAFLKLHKTTKFVDNYREDVQQINQSRSIASLAFKLEEPLSTLITRENNFGSIKASHRASKALLTVPEKLVFPSTCDPANLRSYTLPDLTNKTETTQTPINIANNITASSIDREASLQDEAGKMGMQVERFIRAGHEFDDDELHPRPLNVAESWNRQYSPGYKSLFASTLTVEKEKGGIVRVRLPEDDRVCNITGMALTKDDKLIIVDNGNRKLKVFTRAKLFTAFSLYDEYIKLVACVNLPVRPRDITVIHNDEVAVTTDKNSIVIIDVSLTYLNSSPIMEIIKLPFSVRGIAKYHHTLLVTCPCTRPPCVKRIDKVGTVCWSVSSSWLVKQLFYKPRYICCHNDVAIVIDWYDSITLLQAQTGEVIKRHGTTKEGPKCVCTDSEGRIYLYYNGWCGRRRSLILGTNIKGSESDSRT